MTCPNCGEILLICNGDDVWQYCDNCGYTRIEKM